MFQTNIRQVLGYLFPQIISFHWNIVKKQIDYWVIILKCQKQITSQLLDMRLSLL